MYTDYILCVALGISLSACCGFRVFIPMLIASIAAKFGGLQLSTGFEWMATYPAIISFAVAAVLEVLGYYIPVVDNFLDTIATPSAVIAGTVLSAAVFFQFDPMFKWILALIAGGATAGLIQAGTGLLRLGSTKFTAGTANPVLATAENAVSFTGTILAFAMPLVMALLFTSIVGGIVYYLVVKTKKAVSISLLPLYCCSTPKTFMLTS